MKTGNNTSELYGAPKTLAYAHALHQLMFVLPVVVLFFQLKGTSVGDFFLIQGLFAVAVFALEIPTGYLGDIFSRKKIIILSYVIYLLGHVIWLMFDGFGAILAGELCFALNMALYSGTYEAYFYDALKQQGREKRAAELHGKMEAMSAYGISLATISGSFIFNYAGYQATLGLTMFFTFVSICLACTLPEQKDEKRKVSQGTSKWRDMQSIIKFAVNHQELKYLMVFPAVFGCGTLILFWTLQPLMELSLIPVALFGIFGFINQAVRAFFAQCVGKVFIILKTKNFCLALFATAILGFIAAIAITVTTNIYLVYVLITIVALASSTYLAVKVVSKSMINHRIKSNERATVLSVQSMASKFFSATVMFALKFLVDGFSVQTMLIVMAPIVLILTFIAMKKLIKLNI